MTKRKIIKNFSMEEISELASDNLMNMRDIIPYFLNAECSEEFVYDYIKTIGISVYPDDNGVEYIDFKTFKGVEYAVLVWCHGYTEIYTRDYKGNIVCLEQDFDLELEYLNLNKLEEIKVLYGSVLNYITYSLKCSLTKIKMTMQN